MKVEEGGAPDASDEPPAPVRPACTRCAQRARPHQAVAYSNTACPITFMDLRAADLEELDFGTTRFSVDLLHLSIYMICRFHRRLGL